MMKKILIVTMLLTSSVNADMFQALKDAASTALQEYKEAQEKFNTSLNGDVNGEGTQVVVDNRQFNSLAEEEAYKKQQKQQENANTKKHEQELKDNIIPRIQNLRVSEASFYQKYLVKQNDTQEMIDNKFKNRTQLHNAMQKDFAVLDAERKELYNIFDNNRYSDVLTNISQEHFKDTSWASELSSIFMNAPESYPDGYILSCSYRIPLHSSPDEIYIEHLYTGRENFENADTYEKYLKCTYLTYQERLDAKANKAKETRAQKEQQIRLANEQKERQKVQGACQIWRAKANKQVYSLGIGDRVTSKGSGYYVVQGVNANTLLVNTLWGPIYLQKSDLIPYESLKTAPSQYCYR